MKTSVPVRNIASLLAGGLMLLLVAVSPAHGATLPNGFQDTTVISGLEEPTAVRFSPDGRVFVAEKAGKILVYKNLEDRSPTVFADLREQVYDNGDRGILGLALDPDFPAKPYVYALYTFDHVIGEDPPGAYPRWGQPPTYTGDPCPKPPDADVDACPVSGRLVRLTAENNHAVAEKVLVENWCQQTSSHSVGALQFGPEGALFASGGDGASFISSDYGQFGWPQKNQCGDPPGKIGEALEPPDAEGGSLRSQDVRTPENPITHEDPTGLNGSLIRIDPETGEGLPSNPMGSSTDLNARKIIAYGFRNPFRFSIDPESDEVYVDNVGNGTDEEIDRFSTAPSLAYNSGWPCFEGPAPNPGFSGLGLNVCESLYNESGSTSPPFFFYKHEVGVTPEDDCPSFNGSAISGSSFYEGGTFPTSYDGALFFSDSVRGCIYAMFPGPDGRPDPSTTTEFLSDAGLYPGVDIEQGPGGALYYVSLFGNEYTDPGSVHRIEYFSGNQPPVAHLTATPEWGSSPLNAQFDATGSTDADPEQLTYEWDLQGDGNYEAATTNGKKSKIFSGSQNHTVAVRVSDEQGASSVARVTVYPGDTPPVPEIIKPEPTEPGSGEAKLTWRVGQQIEFEGVAHDVEDGDLAETSLDWSSRLYHCPGGPDSCHAHPLQAFPSVGFGTLSAPDHDYPSHIELTLTAADSRGLAATKTISIYPNTVDLNIASDPPGVGLTSGLLTKPGPFTVTAIEGSHLTLSAPETVEAGGADYFWKAWSDGGARVHTVVANESLGYTAFYGTARASSAQVPPPAPPGTPTHAGAMLKKHPPKRTHSIIARFAFGGGSGGYRCKLDGGRFKPCSSPRVYKGLEVGKHTFVVMTGDADSAPARFAWRVLRADS